MAIRLIDRYPNRANPANESYPHGSGRNKSSPTAIDGTPFDESRYNDHEGFFQSLLEAAEVTPNNTPDTVPDSQYADALSIVANGLVQIDVGGSTDAVLDYNQARVHGFRLTGTLTGDIDVVVPDTERMYTVVNDTTGDFTVTVKTALGSGVVVSQGQTFVVRCDGADVVGKIDNQRTIYVGSVAELEALSLADNARVDVTQFWPNTGVGFGQYEWQASRNKTEHNGVSIIDPVKLSELGTIGVYGTYFTPATSGTGCFVFIGTPTIYNAGAVDDPNASNAEAINAAIQNGARGAPMELTVLSPIVLPSERVYFDSLKLTASSSFVGNFVVDSTTGLNFEDLHVSANNQPIVPFDRDNTTKLSSGYFKNFIVSDVPMEVGSGPVTFRGVDNLCGRNITLKGVRSRDGIRARYCKNGEVIGVTSIDCGARTCTVSNLSENFFFRKISITGDVQNTGSFDGGAHLYTSGEELPGVVNCGFSDIYIHSPLKEAVLVKFSRNSRGCSIERAYGIMRSGTGFNGVLSAQGSPNSAFRDIDIENTQDDTTGTASLIFCRPHPTTGTQSSGSRFINVRISGYVEGFQIGSRDTGGVAGTIEDIIVTNVYIKTAETALAFTGGSYRNISFKDSEFYSTGGRTINCDFTNMGTVEDVGFENITVTTEAATEAARFPNNVGKVLRSTFKRPYVAGEDVALMQNVNGIIAHNTFWGGSVYYTGGIGTLAGNFNVVIDA